MWCAYDEIASNINDDDLFRIHMMNVTCFSPSSRFFLIWLTRCMMKGLESRMKSEKRSFWVQWRFNSISFNNKDETLCEYTCKVLEQLNHEFLEDRARDGKFGVFNLIKLKNSTVYSKLLNRKKSKKVRKVLLKIYLRRKKSQHNFCSWTKKVGKKVVDNKFNNLLCSLRQRHTTFYE